MKKGGNRYSSDSYNKIFLLLIFLIFLVGCGKLNEDKLKFTADIDNIDKKYTIIMQELKNLLPLSETDENYSNRRKILTDKSSALIDLVGSLEVKKRHKFAEEPDMISRINGLQSNLLEATSYVDAKLNKLNDQCIVKIKNRIYIIQKYINEKKYQFAVDDMSYLDFELFEIRDIWLSANKDKAIKTNIKENGLREFNSKIKESIEIAVELELMIIQDSLNICKETYEKLKLTTRREYNFNSHLFRENQIKVIDSSILVYYFCAHIFDIHYQTNKNENLNLKWKLLDKFVSQEKLIGLNLSFTELFHDYREALRLFSTRIGGPQGWKREARKISESLNYIFEEDEAFKKFSDSGAKGLREIRDEEERCNKVRTWFVKANRFIRLKDEMKNEAGITIERGRLIQWYERLNQVLIGSHIRTYLNSLLQVREVVGDLIETEDEIINKLKAVEHITNHVEIVRSIGYGADCGAGYFNYP